MAVALLEVLQSYVDLKADQEAQMQREAGLTKQISDLKTDLNDTSDYMHKISDIY